MGKFGLIYTRISILLLLGWPCAGSGYIILFTRKSNKALAIDINAQGIEAGDDDINSEIKFVSIEKEWAFYVSADDKTFAPNLLELLG